MSKKDQLRQTRAGTIINAKSQVQEAGLSGCIWDVIVSLKAKFPGAHFMHESNVLLSRIVGQLRVDFPTVQFHHHFHNTSLRPDGGVLFMRSIDCKILVPILIAEVKNQGTNDLRAQEGKSRQAKGNAIERLGKNVIGFRTMLLAEGVFPFVCFGYGCDFAADSSILDRVTTIAMFGPLNQTSVVNEGPNGRFNRGSFYFREAMWTSAEMTPIMIDIATRAVQYYFSKHGEAVFCK